MKDYIKKAVSYISIYLFVYKKIISYGKLILPASIIANILDSLSKILYTYLFGLFVAEIATEKFIFNDLTNINDIVRFMIDNKAILYGLSVACFWLLSRGISAITFSLNETFYSCRYIRFTEDTSKMFINLNLEDIQTLDIYGYISQIRNIIGGEIDRLYKLTCTWTSTLVSFITVSIIVINHNSLWFIVLMLSNIPEAILNIKFSLEEQKRIINTNSNRVIRDYSLDSLYDPRTFPEKKINNIGSFLFKAISQNANIIGNTHQALTYKSQTYYLVASYFSQIPIIIFQVRSILLVIKKTLNISNGINLFNFADQFGTTSTNLVQNTLDLAMLGVFLKPFYEFAKLPTLHNQSKGTKLFNPSSIDIKISNLSFKYPNTDKYILKNFNLNIKNKEKVLILGKDGSGKSSLVKLVSGLFKIQEGDIIINNVSIQEYLPGEWKNNISCVLDDTARYYFSIKENIILGDTTNWNKEKFKVALYVTYLDEWLEKNQIDINLKLGNITHGVDLPSGHWQRLAIARAIYRDREFQVFDEAFSNIDYTLKYKILSRLMDYWKNKTVMVVDEDKTLTEYFDEVVII